MDIGASTGRIERKAVWGRSLFLACTLALTALAAGCGDVVRQGSGSSYLIVNGLEAASGAIPNEFGGTLGSDVVTVVKGSATIFSDPARVRFALGMKDAGGVDLPTRPTTNNFITVNRYHVRFIRADGRNTPGVDVPYPFDGAFTVTVRTSEVEAGFTLVRIQAKAEAPLAALARNFLSISTIAEITFYGQDQTGNEVSAVGHISVNFANFGDPDAGEAEEIRSAGRSGL
jgi:hypothetical protein